MLTEQELVELREVEKEKRKKLSLWHEELIKLGKLDEKKRLRVCSNGA